MNHYHTLGLDPAIHLDPDTLKAHYQDLAAEHHPDRGGDSDTFRAIHTAYQTLSSPAKRLTHFMELQDIPYDPRGTLSPELMDLFMAISSTLQDAEAHTKAKARATTALSQALLEKKTIQLQQAISQHQSTVQDLLHYIHTSLQTTPPPSPDSLPQRARDLAFLEKWQHQLQQAFAKLF